jgi:integrase
MWARQPADAHPARWRQRLSVVRGFARYLATIDPASEIPSRDLLPGARQRLSPHIYTDAEIAGLMAAARGLRPPLRAARHETLIGLLAVTGMRPGEAIGLDRADVDLRHRVLHVRAGKQRKQREVPVRESTIGALRDYARQRDARFPAPSTPVFTFKVLVDQAGLQGRGARRRPRPHDLRHSLAVRTLIDWHHAGEDIDRRMPVLSTLLGHVDPASTWWYLEAVPELMALVSQRLERLSEVLS